MTGKHYLALDYGADSGRAIRGTILDNKISLEEIHRFSNPQTKTFNSYHWDMLYLFRELKNGLTRAAAMDGKIEAIGVDTWGVDFGLVAADNQLLGNPYCYRDPRTNDIMERAFKHVPRDEMYSLTGIQFMQFNSIFQLYAMVEARHPFLDFAETLLFMPDLLNFLMTGEQVSEYSIASTSQLLNAQHKAWEPTLFEKLDLPLEIMPPVVQPGTVIGNLLPSVASGVGLDVIPVVAPGCHDTASAIAAVPASGDNWAYLSSGTWSLIGVEVPAPIVTEQSLAYNFTNEGGVGNTIRFLRNATGMWLLQRCMYAWKDEGQNFGYDEILRLADKATPFKSIVNPDDAMFLNPPDMRDAIREFCAQTDQPQPESTGEFARCIFESLALKYRHVMNMIHEVHGGKLETLHIVGGGSQNDMLNHFAANATGMRVVAGPVEATALGNIMVQAIARGEIASIAEGREMIRNSFSLKTYEPQDEQQWLDKYEEKKALFAS